MHDLHAFFLKEQRFLGGVIETDVQFAFRVYQVGRDWKFDKRFGGHDEIRFVLVTGIEIAEFEMNRKTFIQIWHRRFETSANDEGHIAKFSGVANVDAPEAAVARRDELVPGFKLFANERLDLSDA
jgi:hypothetical protein